MLHENLYDFNHASAGQVQREDGTSTTKFSLANETIVFYDKFYDEVMVNTNGFITLGTRSVGTNGRAVLAPFMSDLHNAESGAVYYEERRDEQTLARATRDIQRAFDDGIASNFRAKTAFIVTWSRLENEQHPRVHFTFQCVIVSDGHASYVIFLYPSDELVSNADELRNLVTARVGFSNTGNEQLEELSAAELIEGGNVASGVWVFQIGGVLQSLGESQSSHHMKTGSKNHRRRDSGFTAPEVNVNDDYNPGEPGCGNAFCDPFTSSCVAFAEGSCCICLDGFVGNGAKCVSENESIPINPVVSGYLIVMNPDNSWSNESASAMSQHSYLSLEDGRAFTALAGDGEGSGVSARLILALQPMAIFTSTLGWLIAKAEYPAVNGFQYSGGSVVSDTYIRYTTGAYEFRIRQELTGFEDVPEMETRALKGTITFNGRLPSVAGGVEVSYDDYTQVYMRTGPGTLRSRDTLSYRVGDKTHSYTIDQSIQFQSCDAAYEHVPQNLAVDVSHVYTKYFESERSLRYAMDSNIRPADTVGVRPTEPTPGPVTQPPEPSEETSLTICERLLADANKFIEENPFSSENYFIPTCTDIGRFAPRQCQAYDSVCWCVDQDTGEQIPDTRTEPGEGYQLDCSNIDSIDHRTPCQIARANAEDGRTEIGSDFSSMYMPRCMESGAFEPVQQLPDGSFMCVDFNGEEVSRSNEEPQCLTPCQTEAYIAKTSNVFLNANLFEISCTEDGEYAALQCRETYCYCIDTDGIEYRNSRVETTSIYGDSIHPDCEGFRNSESRPTTRETTTSTTTTTAATTTTTTTTTVATTTTTEPGRPSSPGRLIFAQSMGINSINLPISRENFNSKRLYASSDQRAVAVSYDCDSGRYFWTDVAKRRIYSSKIDGNGSRTEVISTGLRSPEGIAVDFINGNIYWTDSEYNHIEVAKYDGSSRAVLVNKDMVNPRGIALDPIRGRMYWTDWNRDAPKIWVADMDGGNKRVLVSEDLVLPNDITIDFYNQKVCFVDAGTYKVECMSLDGEGRHPIYQMGQVPHPHPFGLVVDGDMLYYSSWKGSKVVHSVNWRTGVHIAIANPRGAHGKLFGVALVRRGCPRGYNRCSYSDNGGCADFCLPVPGGHRCKCGAGSPGCES